MLQFLNKKRGGALGFTLIELLVVIAIIGVLASIVLASLNSARKKSRDARRVTDLKQIQLALELYFDGGSSQYPAANATTCASPPGTGATENYGLQDLVINGYMPQIPRDPLDNTKCYRYTAATSGTRAAYHLGAGLEEHTNLALTGDKDAAVNPAYTTDFTGLSAAAGNVCDTTVATAQPGGGSTGEKCYDLVP